MEYLEVDTFWTSVKAGAAGGFEIAKNEAWRRAEGKTFPISTIIKLGGLIGGGFLLFMGAAGGVLAGIFVAAGNWQSKRD